MRLIKYLVTTAAALFAAGVLQAQPTVNVPPSSATKCTGSPVTFTVDASPEDSNGKLTYLWFFLSPMVAIV